MIQRDIVVTNSLGIHARPASLIVQTATPFECEIALEKDGTSANAKSIMSVMMLAAACDAKVTLRASGKDEEKAVDALTRLFEAKFNES
jgi:phosphocarrier protein HPr